MAGASGQSDLGLCSESEDGVWISVECVEHICGTKKQCVIEDMKQMMICMSLLYTCVDLMQYEKFEKIWIWISKSLVDRSIPLSTCSRLQCHPREGDMVLLDNYLVMHGRCPFEGTRLHAVSWFKSQMLRTAENEYWGNHQWQHLILLLFLRPWLFKSCSLMETCRLQGGGIFLADMNSSFQAMLISFAKQAAANFTIAFRAGILDRRAGHGVTAPVPGTPRVSHAWISLKAKASWPCVQDH